MAENVMKLNHVQVMEIIPNRDPMLLIDEVSELEPGKRIIATFWVDPARDIFRGHFPGDPMLPGVYTVEATAQATDLILMTQNLLCRQDPPVSWHKQCEVP